MRNTILRGDALAMLRRLPDESVHCVVTSPPYWNLRDYGVAGQIGLEATPDEWCARLVEVFAEVRRVLRSDGTCWVNVGDAYASHAKGHDGRGSSTLSASAQRVQALTSQHRRDDNRRSAAKIGLKDKDVIGLPWMLAFALRADGWWLRSEIIWHKPNCMPSSVADRPTNSHETIFLLAKSARYFYDAEAIAEPATSDHVSGNGYARPEQLSRNGRGRAKSWVDVGGQRNKRDVWTVATQPFADAHFATFPPKLIEPCILAGCPVGGIVLDPFFGAGTVGVVCRRHGRDYLGIELNPVYVAMAEARIANECQPVLWTAGAEVSA